MAQHYSQNSDECSIFPQPFPPHTYLGNFFQHLLLWGLESSELEAEVKKEKLEGEPGTSPTLGAPLRYHSRVDTKALKFKLQQTKKGVHDKWWDSSALWKIGNYTIKIWMSSFNMTPWGSHLHYISQAQIYLSDSKYKRGLGVVEGTELSINFHIFLKNERIGLTWPSWN